VKPNPQVEGFSELVCRTGRASHDVCEKVKLFLRPLLPGIEALQKDDTHFSPRLMLLMLARAGEQLSPENRQCLERILEEVDALQPQLSAWRTAVDQHRDDPVRPTDAAECAHMLRRLTEHGSTLDALLATGSR
jgi:hypothetical protein